MSYLSKLLDSETYSLFYQKNSNNIFFYNELSSGKIYYKNKVYCLISGEESPSSLQQLTGKLKNQNLESNKQFKVWHLFYEFGFETVELKSLISDQAILAIELCYQKRQYLSLDLMSKKSMLNLKLEDACDEKRYQKNFKRGYAHLEKGNCYQFNLTEKFTYSFSAQYKSHDIIANFFKNPSKLSAYAHATHIPLIQRLFISNSPECLFSMRKCNDLSIDFWNLQAMPIKGTVKRQKNDSLKKLWKKLIESEKNENELLMITDLLRNDLSKIEKPRAKVIFDRKPLLVPGLLHQYSLIEVPLSRKVNIDKIIKALFPGGSITGAPKKRVMKILRELENRDRGFYCGSTILLEESRVSASINIRSADIDMKKSQLEVAAGGGVTLMSEWQDEYEELKAKINSFISLFL